MEFVEWAGCSLPSEYEWERAGRDERPNKANQYTFPGKWNRRADVGFFAWWNNPLIDQGPLPVDDNSVAKGDGPSLPICRSQRRY